MTFSTVIFVSASRRFLGFALCLLLFNSEMAFANSTELLANSGQFVGTLEQESERNGSPEATEEAEAEAEANDTPAEADTEKKPSTSGQDGDESEGDQPEESAQAGADEKKVEEDKGDGGEKSGGSNATDKAKPKPFSVTAQSLKLEAELEGVFVAEEMEEVALRPDVWTRFVVVEAVEHGAEVLKGDVLIQFDDERLEQELAQEAINQRLEELALRSAENELPREVKLLELKYQEAKRRYDQLAEDYQYYLETDRPFSERVAHFRYESARENLESQREELAQLKKMYAADDITEETEQIVLRRQEFGVKTAELSMELQTANRDYTLDVLLPRNDEVYLTMLEQAKISMEQARASKESGVTRGTYDLEKKRESRAASLRRHAKLLNDRALMALRAPSDGTVYYGRNINGQWAEVSSMTSKLSPFATVAPNAVLVTIVKQRPLTVVSSIAEKDLPNFKNGQSATVSPTSDKEVELSAKVSKIGGVPGGNRKFDLRLELGSKELPEWLVAGMTCNVQVTVYENEKALLIPEELVLTDEDDEKKKYVMLLEKEGEEPVRRDVKLGRSKDKMVEVLEGLVEGDEIVKEDKKKGDSDK